MTEFAEPPADLALPTHGLRKYIHKELNLWQQNMLARFKHQASASGRGPAKKVYCDFAKRLVGYSEWFWKSLSDNRALHHDVYLALVSRSALITGSQR